MFNLLLYRLCASFVLNLYFGLNNILFIQNVGMFSNFLHVLQFVKPVTANQKVANKQIHLAEYLPLSNCYHPSLLATNIILLGYI